MYYFYSIHHKQSNVRCLSISSFNPLSKRSFIGYRKEWKKFLKRYNPGLKHGKTYSELSKDIAITIMHQDNDLNVIKRWRDHYYKHYNVYDNPKFIDYYVRQESEKKRKKNKADPNYVNRQGYNLRGRSLAKECKLRWYNDGYNKNIYVKENTQPSGYILGRINKKGYKHSDETRAKMKAKAGTKVISPTGKVFESMTAAAKAYGVKRCTINHRIKTNKLGDNGWRYFKD